MAHNYQYPVTAASSNANITTPTPGQLSQSNNQSQTFSVASALAGAGFNPRVASYGGYETYQYTSTGNNASPVIGVSSLISGVCEFLDYLLIAFFFRSIRFKSIKIIWFDFNIQNWISNRP